MLNSILKIPKRIFSPRFLEPVRRSFLPPLYQPWKKNGRPDISLPLKNMRFAVHQPSALDEMAAALKTIIDSARNAGYEVVILCIGTDRSTGDALGPLTGTKLQSINFCPDVYGTLEVPVHATNLKETLHFISTNYTAPFIIAVDACLGKVDNIGWFTLGRGSLKPGAALNKDLPEVGDVYITGVVNAGGFMEHMVLQSTRLSLVVKMADTIAQGLSLGLGGRRG